MSEREPGQLLWEASRPPIFGGPTWATLDGERKAFWAAVESTIRADERAKVIEECAKVCDDEAATCHKYGLDEAQDQVLECAAIIRAKIGAEHG